MLARPRSLTPAGRRLVGSLAVLVGLALLAVETGYAPTALVGSTVAAQPASALTPADSTPAGGGGEPDPTASELDTLASEPDTLASEPDTLASEPDTLASEPDTLASEPSSAAEPAQDDPVAHGTPERPAVHVVEAGDTASAIAERYGVQTRALARANAHHRADRLRPGDELVIPDPSAPRPLTAAEAIATAPDVDRVLTETAARYGWNPATVKAIAWYESRWNQRLVSSEEAIGVMQVQPDTGRRMEQRVGRTLDLHDLHDNVEAGVAYLDELHARYRGDLRAIIAAYHQGPTALRDRGIYGVSHTYTDEVIRLRAVFGG